VLILRAFGAYGHGYLRREPVPEEVVMDEKQHDRFGEAVERKRQEAKEASEHPEQSPRGSAVDGDEQDLVSPARTQDDYSPRAKGTQHKKVTADKWNQ
jgi:hypothetical protein